MPVNIIIPLNSYLIDYKGFYIGRKYFDLKDEPVKLYDRVNFMEYKLSYSNVYKGLKSENPFIIPKSKSTMTKFNLLIDVKTKDGMHLSKIEQSRGCGYFIEPIKGNAEKIPFILDVQVTKTKIIQAPVIVAGEDIKDIVVGDIIVKEFAIIPPEIAKTIDFGIYFDAELYDYIYELITTNK